VSASQAAAAAGSLQADFNNDGFVDLAVGVPGEDVGAAVEAGAVDVLYGSAAGLTSSGSRAFWQGAGGAAGSLRAVTGWVKHWPPATSTMTGSPIWPSEPRSRVSGPLVTPGRSMCCTARPGG